MGRGTGRDGRDGPGGRVDEGRALRRRREVISRARGRGGRGGAVRGGADVDKYGNVVTRR